MKRKSFRSTRNLMLFLATLGMPSHARADALPYTVRTQPFNAWQTTVFGDIHTVGMAGATVGLGDSFIASTANPAGPAMTLQGADLSFTSNSVRDGHVQNYINPMNTNNLGFAWTMYPWGISMGYVQSYREGQDYQIGATPSDIASLSVTTREFDFGVSRVFFDNKFSLGIDLVLGQAEREITGAMISGGSTAYHGYKLGGRIGTMYQFPERFLLGMSYSLPMSYGADAAANPTTGVQDFFQPVEVPETFAVGLGWIPNRHFRADLTVYSIGRTPDAALLGHNSVPVGSARTYQPRLGFAYMLADYSDFAATLFTGTYYEASRILDSVGRFHITAGLEVKPWILCLGWGVDSAPDYRNYLVSISIDVIKTMTKLEIIPKPTSIHSDELLPKPGTLSDAGLARPLVRYWHPQKDIDPISAGLAVPRRIAQKIQNVGDALANAFVPDANAAPVPPAPKPVPPPPNINSKKSTLTKKRKPASDEAKRKKKKKRSSTSEHKSMTRPEAEQEGRPLPSPVPPPPRPNPVSAPPAPLKPPKNKAKYRTTRDAPEDPGAPVPVQKPARTDDEDDQESE